MDKLLSRLANVTTILKDLPNAVKEMIYPAVLTTSGSATAILSEIRTIHPKMIFFGVGLVVVGLIWNPIRKKVNAMRVRKNLHYSSGFRTVLTDVVIDIAPSGKSAKFKQNRHVECLETEVLEYIYKFFPPEKYSNFKHDTGNIKAVVNSGDHALDLKVRFLEPFEVGSKHLFKLSCDMRDIFLNEDEQWSFTKCYQGTENYKIQMNFAKSRTPKNFVAEVIKKGDPQTVIKIYYPKTEIIRKNISYKIDIPALEDGQDVIIKFKW